MPDFVVLVDAPRFAPVDGGDDVRFADFVRDPAQMPGVPEQTIKGPIRFACGPEAIIPHRDVFQFQL